MKKETKIKISALFFLTKVFIIFLFLILLLSFNFYLWFFFALLISYLFNSVALFGVIDNKRTNNQNKFVWVLVLVLFPGVGAYIYYSTSRIPQSKKKVYEKSKLLKSDSLKSISNSDIHLLDSGDEKFKTLFSELEKAKKYINIQYFIMTEGIIFSQLKTILIKKAKEGVKIRVLYDYVGSGLTDKKAFKDLVDNGIEVLEFGKVKIIQQNGTDNFRNHNKIVVIDGRIAFFGGLNIADEYAMVDKYFGDWYDTHFLLEGEVVRELNSIFINHWFIGSKKDIKNEYTYPKYKIESKFKNIKILADSPFEPKPIFYKELINQINSSVKSIKIITPYVVIPSSLREPIRNAIARGVKIELVTIGLPDKKSAYIVGKYELDSLYDIGVNSYRTENIFCHTKMFLFDNKRALFGTTNLDFRALYLHFETNIYIESKNLDFLNNHFDMYMKKATPHTGSRREWTTFNEIIYLFIRMFKGIF